MQREQTQLITIANTIDEWKNCQKQWLYLHNIFEACKEIKEKCSKEWQTFSSVNKQWEGLMKKVSKKRLVKAHCTEKVCNELKQNNLKMDEVQKRVEAFLDEKRKEFPRLFFISNDELLQLLSNNSIEGLEPQLNKLFDQLYGLTKH